MMTVRLEGMSLAHAEAIGNLKSVAEEGYKYIKQRTNRISLLLKVDRT